MQSNHILNKIDSFRCENELNCAVLTHSIAEYCVTYLFLYN